MPILTRKRKYYNNENKNQNQTEYKAPKLEKPDEAVSYIEHNLSNALINHLVTNLKINENKSAVDPAAAAEDSQNGLYSPQANEALEVWRKNIQKFLEENKHLKGKPIPNDWFERIFKSTADEWERIVNERSMAIMERDKGMRTQRGGKTMKKRKNSKSKRKHKGKSHKKKGKH